MSKFIICWDNNHYPNKQSETHDFSWFIKCRRYSPTTINKLKTLNIGQCVLTSTLKHAIIRIS